MQLQRRDVLKEHVKFMELVGITAAPTGAVGVLGQIGKVGNAVTSPERAYLYWTAGLTMVTGGAIGFAVGYKDKQDWDAPTFLKGMNDERTWQSYLNSTSNCLSSQESRIAVLAAYGVLTSGGLTQEKRAEMEQKKAKVEQELREGICAKYLKWAHDR